MRCESGVIPEQTEIIAINKSYGFFTIKKLAYDVKNITIVSVRTVYCGIPYYLQGVRVTN